MKILNSRFVQVWDDTRLEKVVLVNHMWREDDEIHKNGFRLYFQEILKSELLILTALERSKNEEENTKLLNQLDNRLLRRLINYKYVVDSHDKLLQSNIWFSQAGQYLYSYFRSRYKLLYPERPSRVLLLPTMRCNGNCVFCITNSKIQNSVLEFTDDSWKKITHRVVNELNPCNIDIVGGEPLLRKEAVFSIIEELENTNIVLKLITNGENLDFYTVKRLASHLKKMNHNVQVSLDGDETITKKIRPGISYSKLIDGIKFLSEEKINYGVNVTITKLNINEIDRLVEFIDQYKPIYVTFGPLQVSSKAPQYCQEIMISNQEEKEFRLTVKRLKVQYPHIIFNYDKKEYPYDLGEKPLGNKKKLHTCTGFLEEMTIYSDGHILPCLRATTYKEFFGPNILESEQSLQDIWLNSDIAKKYRTTLLAEPCSFCGFNQQCNQGCPLETYQIEGVFGGFDPHCKLYKKRRKEEDHE